MNDISKQSRDQWGMFQSLFGTPTMEKLRTLEEPERIGFAVSLQIAGQSQPIRRYLELGMNCGASFFLASHHVMQGGLMVGVDKSAGKSGQVQMRNRVCDLIQQTIRATYVINSLTDEALPTAKEMGPYDVVFIDADHSYEAVKRDFENYSPLVRRGGMIIFHDIFPDSFGVKKFWNEIKSKAFVSVWEFGLKQGLGAGTLP